MSFLGLSPVPLPSHLTFSPGFPTACWIWSLHPVTLKSSTSSIFSVFASDPIVLSGSQLQTCGVNFFIHPSELVSHQIQLDFFPPKYCSLTSFLCFPTAPTSGPSEYLIPGIPSTASQVPHGSIHFRSNSFFQINST